MSRSSQRHARELYGLDSNGWDGDPGTPGSPGGGIVYGRAILTEVVADPSTITVSGAGASGLQSGTISAAITIDTDAADLFEAPVDLGDSENTAAAALAAVINASSRYTAAAVAAVITVTRGTGVAITAVEVKSTP